MATLDKLPVKQLYDHLVSGGFIDSGFTDIFGDSQPKLVFQADELNLVRDGDSPDGIDANERVVMIRESGTVNSSTRIHIKTINMLLVVVGKTGDSDRTIIKGYMTDIEDWLVANYSDGGCISNIEFSGAKGPDITDDGRRAFSLSLVVTFNL